MEWSGVKPEREREREKGRWVSEWVEVEAMKQNKWASYKNYKQKTEKEREMEQVVERCSRCWRGEAFGGEVKGVVSGEV